MGITIGSWEIADVRVQGVTLHRIIGGFDLVFGLYLNVRSHGGGARRASIIGARVTVKPSEGEPQALGFARSERPFEVVSSPYVSTSTPDLHLYLQPGQLAALEALRETGDLSFDLLASGTGTDEHGEQHVQGHWHSRVSRSDWIQQLRIAGARNVVLLEVPIPFEGVTDGWKNVAAGLRRAEEQYRSGDYPSCISSCRTAMEELGMYKYGNRKWAKEALQRLGSRPREMSKEERAAALCAVLRHYTHQAHHGPSEGGVSAYTRADAQFVISVTAAAASLAQAD